MRTKQSYVNSDDGKIVVGVGSFGILLAIAILGGVFSVVLLQVEQGRMYDVAIQQFMMLLGGMALFMLPAMMGKFAIRTETHRDYSKWITGGVLAFVIARIAGLVVMVTGQRLFGLSSFSGIVTFNIVATAAVYEEVFFSLGLGTILMVTIGYSMYRVLLRVIRNREMAWMLAHINVGIVLSALFAIIHAAVYSTDPLLMSYLFVVRMVFYLSYAITRNIMTPTLAHLLNNASVVLLGM